MQARAFHPTAAELPRTLPAGLRLPEAFGDPQVALPGVLVVQAPPCSSAEDNAADKFCRRFGPADRINQFPLIALVDDSEFAARRLENWLWTVFTRSNPAADVHGIGSETRDKHWGCRGSLVIDARIKPHHAPLLSEDPETVARVDALAAAGGPLAEYL